MDAIAQRRIVLQSDVVTSPPLAVTPWLQLSPLLPQTAECLRSGGTRGIRELPEQAGDDEGDLLADVHGVVPDPLQRA
jgi:hypothetical protein